MQPTPLDLAPLRSAIEHQREFTDLLIDIIQNRAFGAEALVPTLPMIIDHVSTVAFSLANRGNEVIQRQAKEIDRLKAANERLEAEVAKNERDGNVKELE